MDYHRVCRRGNTFLNIYNSFEQGDQQPTLEVQASEKGIANSELGTGYEEDEGTGSEEDIDEIPPTKVNSSNSTLWLHENQYLCDDHFWFFLHPTITLPMYRLPLPSYTTTWKRKIVHESSTRT